MTERWRVLWVGDPTQREFAAPHGWLARHADVRNVDWQAAPRMAAVAAAAMAPVAEGQTDSWIPDAVIWTQARPGQTIFERVEAWRQTFPLARWIALLGSWCEGEPRSGRIWPGVQRVYWYDWQARFEREFLGRSVWNKSPWETPRTATDVDLALESARWDRLRCSRGAVSQQPPPNGGGGPLPSGGLPVVAVRTDRWAAWDTLSDGLRERGYAAVRANLSARSSLLGVLAVVWDGESLDASTACELGRFRETAPELPVLMLLNFPRWDDHQRAKAAGPTSVMAKPIDWNDMCSHLDACRTQIFLAGIRLTA